MLMLMKYLKWVNLTRYITGWLSIYRVKTKDNIYFE